LSVSKATDSVSAVNSPLKTYYRNYLANYSNYVYSGTNYYTSPDSLNGVVPVATGFSTYSGVAASSFNPVSASTADGTKKRKELLLTA